MLDRCARVRCIFAAHPRLVDAILALLLFAAGVASQLIVVQASVEEDPTLPVPPILPVIIGLAATALPLALRRQFPLTVLLVSTVGFAVGQVLGVEEGNVTALILALAVYNAASYGTAGRRTTITCSISLAIVLAVLIAQQFTGGEPVSLALGAYIAIVIVFNVALFCAMWGLGTSIGTGRRRAALLAEQAAELRREREASAQRAVFAERVRIARELHDVVAHHVSLMGLQAGAARLVMDRDPAGTRTALESIEASSRQAVAELQSLLGFLRQDGEDDGEAARPGLAQLPALAASLRSLGLDVRVTMDPSQIAPGSTVDTSAFRIVQEALTNTLKHASASQAEVSVRCENDVLLIAVYDDGTLDPSAAKPAGGGLGLVGMRERAVLHGGHLTAAPRATGGFAVHAALPMQGAPA